MSNLSIESVVEGVAPQIQQVVLALLLVVKALKEQPHFDKEKFNESITDSLSKVIEEKETLKAILEAAL